MDIKQIEDVADSFGVTIVLAKIMGRRWSFIENTFGPLGVSLSRKIQLNESWGVVVYNWDSLPFEGKAELENRLKKLSGAIV